MHHCICWGIFFYAFSQKLLDAFEVERMIRCHAIRLVSPSKLTQINKMCTELFLEWKHICWNSIKTMSQWNERIVTLSGYFCIDSSFTSSKFSMVPICSINPFCFCNVEGWTAYVLFREHCVGCKKRLHSILLWFHALNILRGKHHPISDLKPVLVVVYSFTHQIQCRDYDHIVLESH